MQKDVIKLSNYLDEFCKNPTNITRFPQVKDPYVHNIIVHVMKLHTQLIEMLDITTHLADGNLNITISKHHQYAGALKDLQASLKNLIWQVERIADGDYNVKVDFFGDVTNIFYKLSKQLKEREDTQKENAKLNEILAKQQLKLLENELNRRTEKYDQFAKSMAEIRSYRHDMQNHLLCMDSLLQEKDYEGVQRYIRSLSDIFTSMNQLERSENSILDALLNDKLSKAKEQHIRIDKKINITRKLRIDNQDWCILIGNALDNSLEALQTVEKERRELSIKINQLEDMLSVQITNTIAHEIHIENNNIETTKQDKDNHGIGLKNIKQTVTKYNGEIEIKAENQTFSLIFLLCNI